MTDLPTVLVLTTVHAADDTRIREKLIRSLADTAAIAYATRPPAPTNGDGIEAWIELRGGRIRRNLKAARLLLAGGTRVAVVHDPELIPAAIAAALLLRRRVVVDVHEHVPGQILTKEWVPAALRRPVAWLAARLLHLAERVCTITLAEPGYQILFRRAHPVFANYPDALPDPEPGDGSIVYVGDVTEARGLTDLAAAAAQLDPVPPVRVIGRCDADLAARLSSVPGVELLGRLPHPEAMEVARHATVGVSPLRDVPNYRFSLPTKVIEYLGTGIAVVATDLPGTRDVIGDLPGVTLVPPGDIDAIRDAVAAALRHPEQRAAAAANAAAVRERFRWPHDAVVRFYRELIAAS